MRAVVRKSDLESLVTRAERCADERSPLPIMRNIVLRAEGARLSVSGCDLYVAFEGDTDAAIESPGTITTPAKDLLERVKNLPDAPVVVELDGERLAIKAKSRKHFLPTLPANDYPKFPIDKSEPVAFTLPSKALKTALDQTCAAIDKKAPAQFSATHLWRRDGRLHVGVAHNHRFHRAAFVMPAEIPNQPVMLSPKAVEDLRAQLPADGEIECVLAQSWIAVKSSAGLYRAKLLLWEEERPFHETIEKVTFPQTPSIQVPRALAIESIKALKSFVNARLTFVPGRIEVEAEGDDGRKSSDEIPIEYDGPKRSMEMQASYLLDVLSSAPGEAMIEVEPLFLPKGKDFANSGMADRFAASIRGEGGVCAFVVRSGDFYGHVIPVNG